MNKNSQFISKLEIMLKANMTPWVMTYEEERFIVCLRNLVTKFQGSEQLRVLIWSSSDGLVDYTEYLHKSKNGQYGKTKPVTAASETTLDPILGLARAGTQVPILEYPDMVRYARMYASNALIIVKDIHHVLEYRKGNFNEMVRQTRDLIHAMRAEATWLTFLSTGAKIPTDLEKEIQLLDMPLPDSSEISELLDTAMRGFSTHGSQIRLDINYTNEQKKVIASKYPNRQLLRDKIIFNLLGLTEVEISQVLTFTFVKNFGITEESLQDIKDMKRQIIEKSGALQFISTPDAIEIGGHDRFKQYVDERGLYLNKKFREHFSLKPPKGVCTVGPPGTGKSLFARYIGYKWQLPLIRLDMGSIYGGVLGESESRLREALNVTEANAPCILWIDELEKALGGLNSNDSGTTQRVFGKLLTWMAERDEMVYLYCTANNIEAIPAEFQRAGRLDSLWWGDLPLEEDCVEIFRIHCAANKIQFSEVDYRDLGFKAYAKQLTGAEIEHVVTQASFRAAHQSELLREEVAVNQHIIIQVMNEVRPYATSYKETLQRHRLKALSKFEFTSSKSKEIVEKLAGNVDSIRREFEN